MAYVFVFNTTGLIMLDMGLCCFVKRFTLWNFKSLYLNPVWIRFILNINFKSAFVNKAFQYSILVQIFITCSVQMLLFDFFFFRNLFDMFVKTLKRFFITIMNSRFLLKNRIFLKCNKIKKKKVIDLPLAKIGCQVWIHYHVQLFHFNELWLSWY